MKEIKRRIWITAALVVGMGISATVAAELLIRNIWAFLDSEPQFQQIFAQIQTASISGPAWLAMILAYAFAYPVGKYCRKWHTILIAALGGIVVWVLLVVVTMLTTKVNDILFGDVLFSLLDVLGKGGL